MSNELINLTPVAIAGDISQSVKTVAATTVPEALGSGYCRELFIFPLRTNGGSAYWGLSSTDGAQHGTLPVVITAAEGKAIDISEIYIDVAVNGEGVAFIKNS
jgi:hypothetical protein